MKINAFVEDLKTKSAAELNEELVAAKKELFNLRRNIARIQTVITEKAAQ